MNVAAAVGALLLLLRLLLELGNHIIVKEERTNMYAAALSSTTHMHTWTARHLRWLCLRASGPSSKAELSDVGAASRVSYTRKIPQ